MFINLVIAIIDLFFNTFYTLYNYEYYDTMSKLLLSQHLRKIKIYNLNNEF